MSKYIHDTIVHNTNAAEEIIPFLIELFDPKSIVDIGCGTGTWLKVCLENNISNILGIEGTHLDPTKLLIPQEFVLLKDLEQVFETGQKFDMAISLEVAEHLSVETAHQFIQQVTSFSDVVVFSAAIPYQGGQNHINEQPLSYWVEHFRSLGYNAFDILRPRFWDVRKVEFWYAQNCCVFVKNGIHYPQLDRLASFSNKDIVHPELLGKHGNWKLQLLSGDVRFLFILKLMAKKLIRIFK